MNKSELEAALKDALSENETLKSSTNSSENTEALNASNEEVKSLKEALEAKENELETARTSNEEVEALRAELSEKNAALEESKSKEKGAHLKVAGVYISLAGKKYRIKDGYVKTRLLGENIPLSSADMIAAANAYREDSAADGEAAQNTLEHLIKIKYAGIELVD